MGTESVRSAAGREDDGFWPVTRCPSTTCGAQGGPASKSGSVCHSRPPMLPCHPSTVFDLRARVCLLRSDLPGLRRMPHPRAPAVLAQWACQSRSDEDSYAPQVGVPLRWHGHGG